MRKLVLIAAMLVTFIGNTQAQFGYTFTTRTQTYQPLTGATTINAGLWDEEDFVVPLGFNFTIDGKTIANLYLETGNILATDSTGTVSAFGLHDADLADRGMVGTGASVSPIRYTVTGNAGSRIFKAEFFNAGFYDELANYSTMDDSINIQLWLYEGSNIVEVHYGDSKISHLSDYFVFGGPVTGFVRNMNLATLDFDKMYLLEGSPMTPTIDSITSFNQSMPRLNSYPTSGTVYRYAPTGSGTTSVANTTKLAAFSLYPTQCNSTLYVDIQGKTTLYAIYNMNGVKAMNGELVNGRNILDVNALTSGMYVIHIAGETSVQKFVKL